MDDRTTLERAFTDFWAGRLIDPVEPAPTAQTPQPHLRGGKGSVVIDELAFLAADRAVPVTPWARWKTASGDLVNSWAARLMRSLYIRPFAVCPPNVRTDIRLSENGATVHVRPEIEGPTDLGLNDPGHWLSAQQIANMRLAGLPTTKRDVTLRAEAGRWIYLSRAPYGARLYCALCLPEAARDDYVARTKARA